MKAIKYSIAILLGVSLVACSTKKSAYLKEGEKSAEEVAPTRAEIDSISYLLGVDFGSFVKGNRIGDNLNMNLIKKGIADALKATGTPQDSTYGKQFRIDPKLMQEVAQRYMEKRQEQIKCTNRDTEREFLAGLEKDKELKVKDSVYYKIEVPGNEVKPSAEDTLVCRYKLTKSNGELIQEITADQEPAEFPVSGLVKGFVSGVSLIGEGGKIKLYIPSSLGYGVEGNPYMGMEPYTTLVFDVAIEKVKKFIPKEEEATK